VTLPGFRDQGPPGNRDRRLALAWPLVPAGRPWSPGRPAVRSPALPGGSSLAPAPFTMCL